ncbi:MAG: hypothetical protein HKN76_19735 [Saprospiraceae bacterium]|nr:hypothetical protein [Saprospiraceae bacterium]
MADLQQKLTETFEAYQTLKRVERHLAQLDTQLTQANRDLDGLEKKLRKEFQDIEKLEKLSIKGLFHQVLGSKEEQIEKERQEYLQASLKYDEAKKSLELLEFERDLLEGKIHALPELQIKLDRLLKLREKSLIESESEAGKKILDLLLIIDTNREFIGNVLQVQTTGKEITSILDQMSSHLSTAKNWGQWDMAGRQRGASFMKHSAIDKARDLAYHAKHLLSRFEGDLKHIYGRQQFNLRIEFDAYSRFTDIFFDNLISDWIVQQKIQNALSSVHAVRDKIIRIMQSLDGEIKKAQDKISSLEEQRKTLIIKS